MMVMKPTGGGADGGGDMHGDRGSGGKEQSMVVVVTVAEGGGGAATLRILTDSKQVSTSDRQAKSTPVPKGGAGSGE